MARVSLITLSYTIHREHPSDLVDAKIDVLVKLHPERPDQFTFEDFELLYRLQTALSKESILKYFADIPSGERVKAVEEAKKAAR